MERRIKYDPGTDSIDGIAYAVKKLGVHGIGEQLSHAIAMKFGRNAFDVIFYAPDLITRDVPGIGNKRATSLQAALKNMFSDVINSEKKARTAAMQWNAFMGEIGASPHMQHTIERMFDGVRYEEMERRLRQNPYQLTRINGIGFRRADEIAKRLGMEKDNPCRIDAGILYVLNELTPNEGHCYLPVAELTRRAAGDSVLGVTDEAVNSRYAAMQESGRLVLSEADWQTCVYMPDVYAAEQEVAMRLGNMNDMKYENEEDVNFLVRVAVVKTGFEYNDKQLEAIKTALTYRLCVITGGPGTGKTTVLNGILSTSCQIALCAPTGRAARRMKEATGHNAQTIHMLLDYNGETFRRNEDNPIEAKTVVCDEASMIDIMLMRALLRAIPEDGSLVLIGDNDQLPSVGAGRVLGDIIASDRVPVVHLTEIYRQKEGSYIIQAVHDIINGRMPRLDNHADDFFFMPVDTEEYAQQTVVELVSKRLPKAYPGREIQVLCPMRKPDCKTGSNQLNVMLQEAVNKYGARMDIGQYRLRLGDRVMQTRNNYRLMTYNGDIGTVKGEWNGRSEQPELHVQFPDFTTVGYDEEDVGQLELAYATTIHKSQGSEYPIVVIVLMSAHHVMLQRNLLYTAVTRAKEICIIVGQREAMQEAIWNTRRKRRYTRLAALLK